MRHIQQVRFQYLDRHNPDDVRRADDYLKYELHPWCPVYGRSLEQDGEDLIAHVEMFGSHAGEKEILVCELDLGD